VSEPKLLRSTQAHVYKVRDATYSHTEVTLRVVLDMTPETMTAAIEVSKNQYAIPAQEETKRAQEETKRFRFRAAIYAPTMIVAIITMARCPAENAKWIALAVICVLGTVEGAQAFERWISKKGSHPQ
jgi:hypothetical protein